MAEKKRPSQKEADAAARELIARMEGMRKSLVQRLDKSARADAAQVLVRKDQPATASVPEEVADRRRRQVAGHERMLEFTRAAVMLQEGNRNPAKGIVVTGRVADAKGKVPAEVLLRFADEQGKEITTERVPVNERGEFVTEIDVKKLGTAVVTATVVSESGKVLHDSPLTFRPSAGTVQTLRATLKKRK